MKRFAFSSRSLFLHFIKQRKLPRVSVVLNDRAVCTVSRNIQNRRQILLLKIHHRQYESFVIDPAATLSAGKALFLFLDKTGNQPHSWEKEASVLENRFYNHQMGKKSTF